MQGLDHEPRSPRKPGTALIGILTCYGCGVFAAAQLGKLAALSALISRDLQLGLAAMAAITSLLEICGALLGGVAGQWLPRLGLARALGLAMLFFAIGSAGSAWAPDPASFVASRLMESLGYLIVAVAAPVLMVQTAPPHLRESSLALWSTFVPVGTAVGAWSYACIAAELDWRWAQALGCIGAVALALALRQMMAGETRDSGSNELSKPMPSQRTGGRIWALVTAFGAYAMAAVGLLALLPSLLVNSGMSVAAAGGWTAIAALANLPASVVGAVLLRHRLSLTWPIATALFVSGGLYLTVYGGVLDSPATAKALAAVTVNLFSGVFACLSFSLVARAAGSPDRLALASGRLTQLGASGALIGPPLLGAAVERWGWHSAGILSCLLSFVALAPAIWAYRRM